MQNDLIKLALAEHGARQLLDALVNSHRTSVMVVFQNEFDKRKEIELPALISPEVRPDCKVNGDYRLTIFTSKRTPIVHMNFWKPEGATTLDDFLTPDFSGDLADAAVAAINSRLPNPPLQDEMGISGSDWYADAVFVGTLAVAEAIRADPTGAVSFSPERAARGDWRRKYRTGELNTLLRTDPTGENFGLPYPELSTRRFKLVTGEPTTLVIYSAYKTNEIPQDVMEKIKKLDFAGSQECVREVADYLVASIKNRVLPQVGKFDVIIPAPSSKPMAKTLADAIAKRLGDIPVITDAVEKTGSMHGIDTRRRSELGTLMFHATRLIKGNVLVVDDFVTSSSTLRGIAKALLELRDQAGQQTVRLVHGVAFSII